MSDSTPNNRMLPLTPAEADTTATGSATPTTTITHTADDEEDANLRRGLDVIQSMINISGNRLQGLRTQCTTTNELTQTEIRILEAKLLRMFTSLLLTKARLPERLPSGSPPAAVEELRQWLRIVGLAPASVDALVPHCDSLEAMMCLDDADLRALVAMAAITAETPSDTSSSSTSAQQQQQSPMSALAAQASRDEEARRLCRAIANLKRCRQMVLDGGDGSEALLNAEDMFWDSWDRPPPQQHHHHHHHPHRHHHHTESNRSPRAHRTGGGGGTAAGQQPKSKALSRTAASTGGGGGGAGSPVRESEQASSQTSISAQFSPPPSADVAATQLAAALAAGRRQTISPEDMSCSGGHSTTTPPTSPSAPSSPSTATTSNSATAAAAAASNTGTHPKFPATPPPRRKLQTVPPLQPDMSTAEQQQQQQQQQQQMLPKSKSHDAQLLMGPTGGVSLSTVPDSCQTQSNKNPVPGPIRSRLHTEPSPDCYGHHDGASGTTATHFDGGVGVGGYHTLQVPRSPVTPLGFHRQQQQLPPYNTISSSSQLGGPMQTSTSSESSSQSPHGHRFCKRFKVMSTCDLCSKQMFFGLKCKECKYRCHKDCEPHVQSTCVPLVSYRKSQQMQQADVVFEASRSPHLNRSGGAVSRAAGALGGGGREAVGVRRDRLRSTDLHSGGGMMLMGGESGGSAGSSCNSSTPSSPAPATMTTAGGGVTQQNTPNLLLCTAATTSSASSSASLAAVGAATGPAACRTQFKFPDVAQSTATAQQKPAHQHHQHHHHQPTQPPIYKPDTVGGITLSEHLIRQEQQQQQMRNASVASAAAAAAAALPPSPRQHGRSHVRSPPDAQATATANTTAVQADQSDAGPSSSALSGATSAGGVGPANATQRGAHLQIPTITKEVTFTSHNAVDDPTATVNSEASSNTDSDRTAIRLDSADDPDEADDRCEADGQWSRQNSVSLKEWDIPFEDINLMEKIGDGRFGTVHRAQWHGAVAIKILKEDYLDNEAFKVEVATFKKTRHENVVLFMGACIRPQAIVTSLCKGNTLYTHIHVRKDKFNLNKTTMVAQQISLGMGYLHARNITHKDLKTKNIFLENGKVVITDFGLFSATKLEYDERLGLRVPFGWLPYLSPEIMQQLQPRAPERRDALPFSTKSDIYAFGTVWYELLCGDLPFKAQAPEAVIFQVGRGMKPTLANLQAARDVKDILMTCWSFDAHLRPDFSRILKLLEVLPKKRLARSPSHPVQLSRSAESVF